MPDDREAWRLVARGLDEEALARADAASFARCRHRCPASDRQGLRGRRACGRRVGAAERQAVPSGWSCASCCRASTRTPGPGTRSASAGRRIRAGTAASAAPIYRAPSARRGRGERRLIGTRREASARCHPVDEARRESGQGGQPDAGRTTTPRGCCTPTGAACRTSTGCVAMPRASRSTCVVVGAGAGGVTLAQRLARAGWRVVILEKGPFWDPDRDWVSDEKGAGPIYWTDKRIIDGRRSDRDGQEQLRGRRRRLDDPLRRIRPATAPLRFRSPLSRRRRGGLADLLRRAEGILRARRARAPGRRPGLAVGRSTHLPPRPASDLRRRRGRLARRRGVRDRDAGRPRLDHQRPLRQPSSLHLSRLLPAGLQGQRESQPADHPPARRDRARGRGPGRLDGRPRRDRRGQRPLRPASPTCRTVRSTSRPPTPSPSAATRSRHRACC